MRPTTLGDREVLQFGMSAAIVCMEDAFRQHARGELIAPPRTVSDVGNGTLVFTPGGSRAGEPIVGFRYYDLQQLGSSRRSEITAVFSADDGSLRGLVTGSLLGALRTGAIGGVAMKYLSQSDARSLAVIGTGVQARTQLQAALIVRDFEQIRIYSRDATRRQAFAEEIRRATGRDIQAVAAPRVAVEEADAVICATTSDKPVIEHRWLRRSAYIANVGPKFRDGHELPRETYDSAGYVVTDAPAQWDAYGDKMIPAQGGIQSLSAIVADGKNNGGTSPALFISLGLAGTEVLLADRILSALTGTV